MNKIYRLKSSKYFDFIHKHGKSIADKNLVLVFAPTKFNLKVGFSVSKKLGKAVVRNKIKRRLRESFRKYIPFLNPHFNYVIIARQGAQLRNYCELRDSLLYLLMKANLVFDKENILEIK